jgi:SOS-response transcriptional repressor LexA
MIGLTDKQAELLMYIRIFIAEHSYAPTYREIAYYFGLLSTNAVADRVNGLWRKGYIERDSMKSRAMRLTKKGEEWGRETPVPNVLSRTVKCPFCKADVVVPKGWFDEKQGGSGSSVAAETPGVAGRVTGHSGRVDARLPVGAVFRQGF